VCVDTTDGLSIDYDMLSPDKKVNSAIGNISRMNLCREEKSNDLQNSSSKHHHFAARQGRIAPERSAKC